MPRRIPHKIAGLLWILGGVAIWTWLSECAYMTANFLDHDWQNEWPKTYEAYNLVSQIGIIVVFALMAVLSAQSRLPWTGTKVPAGDPANDPPSPSGSA